MKRVITLIVVLLWLFIAQYIVTELMSSDVQFLKIPETLLVVGKVGVAVSLLLYPLFGWLADTRYGRYKVIKYSLHILWITSVFYCLLSVVLELLSAYGVLEDLEGKQHAVHLSWYIVLGLGLGGLMANIIQFSIDQLQDRSSEEITQFLRWAILVWMLSVGLQPIVKKCVVNNTVLLSALVIPTLLTLALSLDYLFSSMFIKEPVCSNPVVTIFRIMRFAMKNKYPLRRSAHSYWNSSFCARIDLAKTEYGGPFTANQVEDTKAFWRIIALMIFTSSFSTFVLLVGNNLNKIKYNFVRDEPVCNRNFVINYLIECCGIVVVSITVPIFQSSPCHHFHLYINNIPILMRAAIGMILFLLSMCSYGALSAAGYVKSHSYHHFSNNTCFLQLTEYDPDSTFLLNYGWFSVPSTLYYMAVYVLLLTGGEFLCAQSPYSMKGLLFGLLFGFIGVFSAINYTWFIPFQVAVSKSRLSNQIGCGTVYFFSVCLISVLITIGFCIVYKLYKPMQKSYMERQKEPSAMHLY